ncbi:MAG: tail fiber domain-containing protein [Betaproteobacteria bacterium]|nr:tail fiber domain-containing protein [Betaproteobacteria bacterium]
MPGGRDRPARHLLGGNPHEPRRRNRPHGRDDHHHGDDRLAPTQLLPTTACATNQIPKWSGTAWACATESGGGGGNFSGVTATLSGNLELVNSTATAGNVLKGGLPFIHTVGADGNNTYVGIDAGSLDGFGFGNTAIGRNSQKLRGGGQGNTTLGAGALANSGTGDNNTLIGTSAGAGPQLGDYNTIVGAFAFNTTMSPTASTNTGLGTGVLQNLVTGSGNIAIGYNAGAGVVDGTYNIHIGNDTGTVEETGVTRIGSALSTRAFLAGVRGVTTELADAIPVVVSSTGQMGTASSSRRVKQDIEDMGQASGVLMDLRPVTFRYRSQVASGQRALQYGLVAEEVAEVAPGLAVRSADGSIETVNYPALVPMLLNELQKQQRTIDSQRADLDALRAEMADLKRALGLAR